MPNENAPASQWRERNTGQVDPGVTRAYLSLVGGVYRLDGDPAEADAWFVKDGNGRWRLDDSSAGAGAIVKVDSRFRVVG